MTTGVWMLYNADFPSSDDGTTNTGIDWHYYGYPSIFRDRIPVHLAECKYIHVSGEELTVNAVGGRIIEIAGTARDNPSDPSYTADGLIDKMKSMLYAAGIFGYDSVYTFVCPDYPSGLSVVIEEVVADQDANRGISRGRSVRTWAMRLRETL